jgi:hypothetical protein
MLKVDMEVSAQGRLVDFASCKAERSRVRRCKRKWDIRTFMVWYSFGKTGL